MKDKRERHQSAGACGLIWWIGSPNGWPSAPIAGLRRAAYRVGPAANSLDEASLSYPSLQVTIHHRLAHVLYGEGARVGPRAISEIAHRSTGMDIHLGATIGSGLSSTTGPAW